MYQISASFGAEETCAVGTPWFAEANKWSQLTPTGSPPSARCGHTAAYSDGAGGMLVFGGDDGSSHRLRASERSLREETGMEPRGGRSAARSFERPVPLRGQGQGRAEILR